MHPPVKERIAGELRLKKHGSNKEEHHYLTTCLLIGFIAGMLAGVVGCALWGKSYGMWIAMGATFGMLIGIVVGTVLDYETKDKS